MQEENIPPKTRRLREPSRMERIESYDVIKDLMETQAHATFAQILQDSKQMKKLKDAIRGKNHVEIADEQWLHSDEINQIWDDNEIETENDRNRTTAVKSDLIINGQEIQTVIDSGAATNIITNKLRKRLGIEIEKSS